MDTTTEKQGHAGCGCGSMSCHHDTCGGICGHHHWKHVVIKILVALFIFWCGVQFGELKGVLHGGANVRYGGYSSYGMPGMMYGWAQQ